ncbi:hypothetical protein QA612_08245 [Evansella sp. AB-P1]|uniref:hypothetical protein n=1 Tax=Evansella sp. AB-P1 TaxID=3037653 RepID=UPI00241BFB37|nr:hypothetical protein [Evansella sp. AB-P1]MDG5787483.1 hypothetical protein [Evansella sp. AB-P1]
MQAQRKKPSFLQKVKKRFAGTEEEASVPAKSEKEICRNRGRSQRSCKGSKGLVESFLATAFHDFLALRSTKTFLFSG